MGSIYIHAATHKQATFKKKGRLMDIGFLENLGKLITQHLGTAKEVKLIIDEDKDTHLVLHITGLDDEDPKKDQ